MCDDRTIGVGEIGAGIACCQVGFAIFAVAIKGNERFFLAEVGLANFPSDFIYRFPVRRVPEKSPDIHHNCRREMLAFLRGVHIHSILSQDARTAMHHEEIVAIFDTELRCLVTVFNASHFHKIEEVIAGGAEDTGAKLREEEEEFRNNMVDILSGELAVEEIASVERVFGFVDCLDTEVLDEWLDALPADVGDDMEGEECTEIGFGRHF